MGCPFLLHIGGGFMAKDVAIRAMKTFWQSGVAYLVATFSTQMSGWMYSTFTMCRAFSGDSW